MKTQLQKSWFIVALIAALATGYLIADVCKPLVMSGVLKWFVVALTMFVMALPISFASIKKTLRQFSAPLLAIGLNIVAIPLLSWPLAMLLGGELGKGLIVAAAAPCTLASAAVWTRRAGGNDSVAIVVTVITNAFCFLITPFWVFTLVGGLSESVDFGSTIVKLLCLVVLPMALGQLCRVNSKVADWATANKPSLGVVAQVGVLGLVLVGSAAAKLRIDGAEQGATGWGPILLTIAFAVTIHVVVLVMGLWSSRALGFGRREQIAIGFSGSQKTLMVGLSTAMELGVSILPIIVYHSAQLLIDTVVADRMRATEIAGAEPTGQPPSD